MATTNDLKAKLRLKWELKRQEIQEEAKPKFASLSSAIAKETHMQTETVKTLNKVGDKAIIEDLVKDVKIPKLTKIQF